MKNRAMYGLLFTLVLAIVLDANSTQSQAIPGFDVTQFNIVGGGGSTDNDINNTTEAIALRDNVTGTGPIVIGPTTYNVGLFKTTTTGLPEPAADWGGGGGNFAPTNGYPGGFGGDDFIVNATSNVTFQPGTYTISIASDDGRILDLPGIVFANQFGQVNIGGTGFSEIGFENPTGHNSSRGVFTVAAPTTVALEGMFWERGGGDSFEIAIASGSNGAGPSTGNGFEILRDGALNGAVSVQSAHPVPAAFCVKAYNVIGGNGSNDNDLNNTTEAEAIWNFLDANPGFTGAVQIGNATYNIGANVEDAETVIDYAGGGGNFGVNNLYGSIQNGAITGGEDFSVRAEAFVEIPEGIWSIAVASDDGRKLTLDDVLFTGSAGQTDLGGAGFNFIGREGPTGHAASIGHFVVGPGGLQTTLDAFFWERGGGDSFEISIAQGIQGSFSTAQFQLLQNGTFGWRVAKAIPEPTTATLGLIGLAGLMVRRRRAA